MARSPYLVPHGRWPGSRWSRSSRFQGDEACVRCYAARWLARILLRCGSLDRGSLRLAAWVRGDEGEAGWRRMEEVLGLGAPPGRPLGAEAAEVEAGTRESSLRETVEALSSRRLREAAHRLAHALEPAPAVQGEACHSGLHANLVEARRLLDLSAEEVEFLLLTVESEDDGALHDFFRQHHSAFSSYRHRHLLAAALDLPRGRLNALLQGRLVQLGLLGVDEEWISLGGVTAALLLDSPRSILDGRHLRAVPDPGLALAAHDFDATVVEHLRRLLTAPGDAPVHVLLYGPPGTGKTSFARALARQIGRAVELCPSDEEKASERRMALAAHLRAGARGGQGLVVVDEADALLNTEEVFLFSGESRDRAWVNRLLDEPHGRAIWIVNELDGMAGSVRRRFAYSVPFEEPAPARRALILDRVLRRRGIKRHFPAASVRRLCRRWPLSPALLDHAALQARRVGGHEGPAVREAFERALAAAARLENGEDTPRVGFE